MRRARRAGATRTSVATIRAARASTRARRGREAATAIPGTRVGQDDDELRQVDQHRAARARQGLVPPRVAAQSPSGTAVAATSASEFQ